MVDSLVCPTEDKGRLGCEQKTAFQTALDQLLRQLRVKGQKMGSATIRTGTAEGVGCRGIEEDTCTPGLN